MELENLIGKEEKILWSGKPNKSVFVLEAIFNPLLPIALVWAIFDLSFINLAGFDEMSTMLIPFFLLHLMPVWIYLGGVLLSFRRYRNTSYLITTRGVYVSGGAISFTYHMKPFAQMANISVRRGVFDQKFGVGDVVFHCPIVSEIATSARSRSDGTLVIKDIADYQEVFLMAKKLQQDIYADIQYPNDLRPDENNGYHTEYKAD